MKRKLVKPGPGRPVGRRDKTPRLRAAFSRIALKRAIVSAREADLPVSRVDITQDGTVSLIVGKPDETNETTNNKNPWDEVTSAANEKRTA